MYVFDSEKNIFLSSLHVDLQKRDLPIHAISKLSYERLINFLDVLMARDFSLACR
jgi:hypothetical protein